MLIAYHAKHERHGWREICRQPIDWDGWGDFDRSMIDELIKNGSHVLTCGWNMYQLIEG